MNIPVMAKTELTSFIATKDDKIIRAGILQLNDASVFNCKDLL